MLHAVEVRVLGRGRLVRRCVMVVCLALAGCGGSTEGDGQSGRVTDVIDGDTVEVESLGRVRLIGVDTPEKDQCGEDPATRFTRERLLDQIVQYELGEDSEDRFGRTLAYLSREGQMHNRALLSEGYGRVLTIPPNDKYADDFDQAEREATRTNAGSLQVCDRNKRRAAAQRQEEREAERRRQRLGRVARAQERRRADERAAERRREQQARENQPEPPAAPPPPEPPAAPPPSPEPPPVSGGGGCLPSSACPGKRDGDGDGCFCE